jgi:hypothetical protein
VTTPLDGELAWAISEWNDDTHNSDETVLKRGEIETLTRFLTAKGYAKPKGGLPTLTELNQMVKAAQQTVEDFLKGPSEPATNPAHKSADR